MPIEHSSTFRIHGATPQQLDRLVSLVYEQIEDRTDISQETINKFLAANPNHEFIPERIGSQVASLNQAQMNVAGSQHYDFKGTYHPPLLHDTSDSRRPQYIHINKIFGNTTRDVNVKAQKSDWICGYHIFVWHMQTLKDKFLGEPITESFRAAELCRQMYLPNSLLKPYFVILYQNETSEHELLKGKIMEARIKIPIVILPQNKMTQTEKKRPRNE